VSIIDDTKEGQDLEMNARLTFDDQMQEEFALHPTFRPVMLQ
jgi:hypothetical protein